MSFRSLSSLQRCNPPEVLLRLRGARCPLQRGGRSQLLLRSHLRSTSGLRTPHLSPSLPRRTLSAVSQPASPHLLLREEAYASPASLTPEYTISCEEPTPSCHQICDKLLPCGHRCPALCHPPPCPPCMLVVRKTCRCGRKTAEVPCSQSLECNVKCQELRDCGRHRCGRRCCDGHHSVCTAVRLERRTHRQICNKPLSCGRHVCLLPCHAGECPPCPLKVTIRCECGATTMEVPCKDFRRSLYPPCPQPCRKPSHCHHEHIQEHCCHPGSCPECILPCGKLLPCGHMCKAICHGDSACPPCHEMVEKRCEGGHTLVRVRCCDRDSPAFCDQPCGRLLACEHHVSRSMS